MVKGSSDTCQWLSESAPPLFADIEGWKCRRSVLTCMSAHVFNLFDVQVMLLESAAAFDKYHSAALKEGKRDWWWDRRMLFLKMWNRENTKKNHLQSESALLAFKIHYERSKMYVHSRLIMDDSVGREGQVLRGFLVYFSGKWLISCVWSNRDD